MNISAAPEPEDFRLEKSRRRRARIAAEARFSVLIHFIAYAGVNALLALINLITFAGTWWVLWPLFGWGFGLFIHALVAFTLPGVSGIRRRMYEQELARQKTR